MPSTAPTATRRRSRRRSTSRSSPATDTRAHETTLSTTNNGGTATDARTQWSFPRTRPGTRGSQRLHREQPTVDMPGHRSPRQVMIRLLEQAMKPAFGEDSSASRARLLKPGDGRGTGGG